VSVLELFDRWPSRFAASRPVRGGQGENLISPITIAELPVALMQVTVRSKQREALAAALADGLGVMTLPGPGASHGAAEVTVIWLQPDSWLIQCAPSRAAALHECARAHPGLAAWVDQTHGCCLLRVTGASVRAVLARLCRLDLHERAFASGACAATLVGHVDCLLHRVPGAESTFDQAVDPAFDLLVGSTWADWLLDELMNAADACGWRFLAHGKESKHG